MPEGAGKKPKRNISDQEISLIKAMLCRGMGKTAIQAYFTHPDRPVNYGRITNIEQGTYGPGVVAASDGELDKFLEGWRDKGDVPSQTVAEASVDLSALTPVDPRRLESLFEKVDGGKFALRGVETDGVECKQSFQGPGNDRLLRATAALANNRGGYVLFGVEDASGLLVGLRDDRFKNLDPNQFSQAFRAAMEPCPRFEIGTIELNGARVGAVYVHAEPDSPIIATKDENTFKAGVIYYRYPGESRAISGADFRRILTARDRRARQEAGEMAKRVIELGSDAALLDFRSGQIDGRTGSLFVSPDLLNKLQFIREGEFVQKDGATALRLIGDVQVASAPAETLIREKIVRAGITDRDVLGNFLRQEAVQFPAEYVLHSCHSNKHWLPIFYYVKLAGRPLDDIVDAIQQEEGPLPLAKGRLIDRLKGRVSAKTSPSTASRQIIKAIEAGNLPAPNTMGEVRKQATAIQGWSDQTRPLPDLLSIVEALRAKARSLQPTGDIGSEIRRAAAWLDELYFKAADPSA